ncbi:hypothetical protein PVW48_16655 [Dinoroseobacter sp. PD6]|nr:hypothetical protein [Dinoroseobacter sp. PD6]MDD9718395.1 hypothetical protein [Dinoroseobacter sp. PD6]
MAARLRNTVLAIGLVALTGGSAWLALQACALNLPVLPNACPGARTDAARASLMAAEARTIDLRERVLAAERELARLQCTAAAPDPYRPLDPGAWSRGDLGALYGCWSLDSTYATRDVDTDEVITYPTWQMCFNGQGDGKQVMRGSDGTDCTGPVTARFGTTGQLQVIEADNLSCGDGGYIHRRDIACTLQAASGLQCQTLQPETGGEAGIGMRKLTRPL